MNRRGFFRTLAGAAAIAYDPERLLWVPGKKLISIPPARAPLFISGTAIAHAAGWKIGLFNPSLDIAALYKRDLEVFIDGKVRMATGLRPR